MRMLSVPILALLLAARTGLGEDDPEKPATDPPGVSERKAVERPSEVPS